MLALEAFGTPGSSAFSGHADTVRPFRVPTVGHTTYPLPPLLSLIIHRHINIKWTLDINKNQQVYKSLH